MDRRRILCAAIVGAMVVACTIVPSAHAYERIASITSRPCGESPVWRIQYRLYYKATDDKVLSRSDEERAATIAEARTFARRVRGMSQCNARVTIDVIDMQSAVWKSTTNASYPAYGNRSSPGGKYDLIMNRFPDSGESYAGIAYFEKMGGRWQRYVDFPANDPVNEFSTPQPIANLILHEWLHHVVMFYRNANWPTNDVHGACEHGYDGSCSVNHYYFRDMLRARVRENGTWRGITRSNWRERGTPLAPR